MAQETVRRSKHPMTDTMLRLRGIAVKLGAIRARRFYGLATSSLRILPSWIIVGAQRSSSSSIFKYLTAHPQVGAPCMKEIHYFDHNYHRGINWYKGHFPARSGNRITGEGTPYYMAHPWAVKRIAKDLPGVKLLVVLRNPVDRAYSHFIHERALSREPYASFAEAIAHEPERIAGEEQKMAADPSYYSYNHQNYSYLARGRYAEQVERLFEIFGKERVMVFSTERMGSEPAKVYAETLKFLGLAPHSLAEYRRHNERNYTPMEPALRARLQESFVLDNERLFRLVGTDFGWNAPVTQEYATPN